MAQGRKEMSRNEQVLRKEQGWGGAGESLRFRALKLEVGKATPLYSLRQRRQYRRSSSQGKTG